MFRYCVDMMISVLHFSPSLWGIYPPLSKEEMSSFLLDAGDGGISAKSLALAWQHLNNPDILVFLYENIAQEHRGTVETIARFMNVLLTRSEVDIVVKQTTKDGMQQNHDVFACQTQARNAHKARNIAFDESKLVRKVRWSSGARLNKTRSDIEAAVQMAWNDVMLQKTALGDYVSMRKAALSNVPCQG